jgi:hypothetical protein
MTQRFLETGASSASRCLRRAVHVTGIRTEERDG